MKAFSAHTKSVIKKNIAGWLFILPILLGILCFTVIPVVYAFISSFFDTPLKAFSWTDWGTFVGLENYTKNFTNYYYKTRFFKSLGITFTYASIHIPLSMLLSFLLALLLNQNIKGMRFFRVLYYMPVLIPAVCSGILWNRITDVNFGVMNGLLKHIGITGWKWFDSESTSMISFIFVGMFSYGATMILWLAQLKNIPVSFYESAKLDGAGAMRRLIYITIPMCTPMILYNLIMNIIGVLQTYASVVTLVEGNGVNDSMLFYVMNIYNNRVNEFGYACALSFILFIIIGLFSLLVMKTSKWVYYTEGG